MCAVLRVDAKMVVTTGYYTIKIGQELLRHFKVRFESALILARCKGSSTAY